MKTFLRSFILLSVLVIALPLRAQMVVPFGWNADSMRFAMWTGFEFYPYDSSIGIQAIRSLDTIMANFAGDFGSIAYYQKPLGQRHYGVIGNAQYAVCCPGWWMEYPFCDSNIRAMSEVLQSQFYPFQLPEIGNAPNAPTYYNTGVSANFYFRYRDSLGVDFLNQYDSNDISPYMEFPQSTTLEKSTFTSYRYGNVPQTLCYGVEGRTVLGYSDIRLANALFVTDSLSPYPTKTPLIWMRNQNATSVFDSVHTHDRPLNFSAILEFNVDTLSILTDSSRGLPKDSLSLVRLQIAFKPSGRKLLPYVPFITSTTSSPSASGWYLALDTTITLAIYRKLNDDWRKEDVVNGNPLAPAHSAWHFKQLHVMLRPDTSMTGLINLSMNNDPASVLYSPDTRSQFTGYVHQDSIVSADTSDQDIITGNELQTNPLVEIEILSTYRAKVRIRTLDFQDSIADRFFYRKRINDTLTHSLDVNDSVGGLDDSVATTLDIMAGQMPPGVAREFMFLDTPHQLEFQCYPALGLLEYLASHRGNIHMHPHEQDAGGCVQEFRREKMSHDLVAPSMYENEGSPIPLIDGTTTGGIVFPLDYMYYGFTANHTAVSWPSSSDWFLRMLISRAPASLGGSDSAAMASYNTYTTQVGGFDPFLSKNIRGCAYAAMHHPKNSRFALEAEGNWGDMVADTGNGIPSYYSVKHSQPPPTPEQNLAMFFGGLANGVGAFSMAESVDGGWMGNFSLGLFAAPIVTDSATLRGWYNLLLVHDFNWGHQRAFFTGQLPIIGYHGDTAIRKTTNNLDTCAFPYYLGISNNYRSYFRALSRINAIYDTLNGNQYPLKRFTWLDAYSRHRIRLSPTSIDTMRHQDSTTYQKAFLKVTATEQVDRWHRTGADSAYIDLNQFDSTTLTFAEVGLFEDSISPSQVNYAAIVVNTRTFPSLRDSSDIHYYNDGLDSASRCHSTMGDIDTRKVFMKIDTNQLPAAFRSSYYVLHDMENRDSSWFMRSDSVFAFYLKPGDAKFLYIDVTTGLSTGVMTTNVYNNARHIAAKEISDTLASYVMTYEKTGNIYVAYPVETPDSVSKRINGTPPDTKIEGNGLSHNPSVAVNADSNSGIALVYSVDSAGTSHDSTFIIFRHANFGTPNTFTKDTLDKFKSLGFGFPADDDVSAPAITPAHSGFGKFWVTWTRSDSGGAVTLVDTLGHHVTTHYLNAANNYDVQFVSPASHLKFATSHPPASDTCFLSFQNYHDIYYTKAWIDPVNPNVIDTIPYFDVSYGNPLCVNLHPCTSVTEYGTVEIVWEAIFWNGGTHFAMERFRLGDSLWSVFSDFMAYETPTAPGVVYPSNSLTDEVTMYPLSTNWRDFQRIAFNNPVDNHLYIVHRGLIGAVLNWKWYVDKMSEYSQEPSLPVHTVFQNAVPSAVMYRSGWQNDDGTFDAKITKYDFPLTPVMQELLPHGTFYVTTDGSDCHPGLDGSLGNVTVLRGGTTVLKIGVIPVDTIPVDTLHIGYRLDWKHPITPTKNFKLLVGDWLNYQRYFRAGDYNLGDTTTAGIGLTSTSDYLKMQVVLRDAVTHGMIAVLDTARLTIDGLHRGVFAWSGNIADSGKGAYFVVAPITDSVYVDLEVSRGDTTNSYQLFYLQTYLSNTFLDDLPIPAGSPKVSRPHQVQVPTNHLSLSIYPNPTTRATTVEAHTADGIPTRVDLYDILGNRLRTLFDDLSPTGGRMILRLDCTGIPAGSYFIRARNGNEVLTRRLQLLK